MEGVSQPPCDDVIRELSRSLRQTLGVSLFGIDVIINNQTGQHAVIDINAFPGTCGFALNRLCLVVGSGTGAAFRSGVRRSRLMMTSCRCCGAELFQIRAAYALFYPVANKHGVFMLQKLMFT